MQVLTSGYPEKTMSKKKKKVLNVELEHVLKAVGTALGLPCEWHLNYENGQDL